MTRDFVLNEKNVFKGASSAQRATIKYIWIVRGAAGNSFLLNFKFFFWPKYFHVCKPLRYREILQGTLQIWFRKVNDV